MKNIILISYCDQIIALVKIFKLPDPDKGGLQNRCLWIGIGNSLFFLMPGRHIFFFFIMTCYQQWIKPVLLRNFKIVPFIIGAIFPKQDDWSGFKLGECRGKFDNLFHLMGDMIYFFHFFCFGKYTLKSRADNIHSGCLFVIQVFNFFLVL